MSTAELTCGTVLAYEASTFLPQVGELVPCYRHGYCVVATTSTSGSHRLGGRASPRCQPELLDWLRVQPRTTVRALRRERFTLRLIAAAEREGLVSVDPLAETVVLRLTRDDGGDQPLDAKTGRPVSNPGADDHCLLTHRQPGPTPRPATAH